MPIVIHGIIKSFRVKRNIVSTVNKTLQYLSAVNPVSQSKQSEREYSNQSAIGGFS